MYSSAIAELEKRVKILEITVRNLQQECQRLYQIGYSNGVEVSRKEYADELKNLEDKGFISFHGFLKPEPKEVYDKWVKAWEDWGIKETQIHPIEDEYYRQVDKAIKEAEDLKMLHGRNDK